MWPTPCEQEHRRVYTAENAGHIIKLLLFVLMSQKIVITGELRPKQKLVVSSLGKRRRKGRGRGISQILLLEVELSAMGFLCRPSTNRNKAHFWREI